MSSTKANTEVREMPHLNGSMVQFGLQLHCGQYLALQRLEQERGFSPGCARGARQGAPAHPAHCSLKRDAKRERGAGEAAARSSLPPPLQMPRWTFSVCFLPHSCCLLLENLRFFSKTKREGGGNWEHTKWTSHCFPRTWKYSSGCTLWIKT